MPWDRRLSPVTQHWWHHREGPWLWAGTLLWVGLRWGPQCPCFLEVGPTPVFLPISFTPSPRVTPRAARQSLRVPGAHHLLTHF